MAIRTAMTEAIPEEAKNEYARRRTVLRRYGDPEEVAIDGAPVRKGDLRISEVVRGNLEATDSITLKCEVEGRSTHMGTITEGVSAIDKTIEAICEGARTGNIGDGKIFVVDLVECVRIRTGEKGEDAIG